ncbi:MAG: hypothetical protein LDL11_01420 [Desulfarculus sp.]|nr:hypothetical protein [Desulfarculus sp.]
MKKLRLLRGCRLLTWLAILSWLTGCSHCDFYRYFWQDQRLVETAEKVGFAHVSVLSVAPWHEIEGMLQPSFDLTPEDARQRALPVTVRWEEKLMLALVGKVGVGNDKPSPPAAEAKDQPGFKDWDKFEAANNPILEYQLANALYQEVQILNNYVRYAARSKGYEAFLVRLQVSIMPLAHDMPYDTYVNIGFMTEPEHLRKVMTRDLESTSEINRKFRDRLCAQVSQQGNDRQQYLDRICKESVPVVKRTDPMFSINCQGDERCQDGNDSPKAIPLLVTDSLEAAQTLISAKLLMQAAAAVKRSFEGDAVGAELGAALDKERTKARKDLTSTMTVTRVWDNFLRARFGATRTDEKTYAMVPRNHNISILLLVPKCMFLGNKTQMVVTSTSFFADAFTGDIIGPNHQRDAFTALNPIAENHTFCSGNKPDTARICAYVQNQQQLDLLRFMKSQFEPVCTPPPGNSFASSVRGRLYPPGTPEGVCADEELRDMFVNRWPWLWHMFAAEHQYAQIHKTFLTLDRPPSPAVDQNQTPLLVDDGKEMVAYVSGVKLLPGDYRAFLAKDSAVRLPASHIEAGDKGRRLQITFPSLARAGLTDGAKTEAQPLLESGAQGKAASDGKGQPAKPAKAKPTPKLRPVSDGWRLFLTCVDKSEESCAQTAPKEGFKTVYTYRERPGGDNMVVLFADRTQLIPNDKKVAEVGLRVYFDPPLSQGQVLLRMEGADLVADESKLGGVLTFLGNGKFQVEKSGMTLLALKTSGKSVDFRSTLAGDVAGPPLHLAVAQAAAGGGGDKQAAAGNSGVSVNITTNAPAQTATVQTNKKDDATTKKDDTAGGKEEKKAEAKPAN